MFVFRSRAKLNRMFYRLNKLGRIQIVLLVVCWCLYVTSLNQDDNCRIIELSLFQQNNSLSLNDLLVPLRKDLFSKITMYIYILGILSLIDMEHCPLSIPLCSRKQFSTVYIQILVVISYKMCCYGFVYNISLYRDITYDQLINPIEWFLWCRRILIYCCISSIGSQLISILVCRPADILFDIRYISMIVVQLMGFFICIMFAFFLGIKYASVRHRI